MLQRFRKADHGNVGMVFALSLLPVVGMAGGALDYTRATTTRQKLQAATDMAALGAATANSVSSDAQRIALAQSLFKANDTSGAAVSASVAGDKVTVVADARVKTTLMSVMQVSEIGLSVRSTAARATSGPPACVLALNKTVNGAITFSGSADFHGRRLQRAQQLAQPEQPVDLGLRLRDRGWFLQRRRRQHVEDHHP